jgi:hypothetical protein
MLRNSRAQESRVRRFARTACAAAIAAAALSVHAAPTVAPSPAIPTYGQPVAIQLYNAQPYYLPAVRYTRHGFTILVDYETFANNFGPFPPNMGSMPLPLGELPPGNYTVTARIFDIETADNVIASTTTNLPVAPPTAYGAYSVPQAPHAYEDTYVTLRSAAYFDTTSMRASMVGNSIRVDFNYDGSLDATGGGKMAMYGSVDVGKLSPGTYHVEAWGTPVAGGVAQKYFTTDIVVSAPAVVYEFYQSDLDHYFISADPNEVTMLDNGGQGGWKRTGQTFHAWLKSTEAPPQASPVCRFYASGPNSHFYTADAGECEGLKQLEQAQRAQAQSQGQPFLGWAYEGIAFYAIAPQDQQCPANTTPVYRAYNGRAAQGDPNHRFMTDAQVRGSMFGWAQEGVAFCSPA